MGVYLRDNMGCMTDFGYVILDTNLLMFMTIQACTTDLLQLRPAQNLHDFESWKSEGRGNLGGICMIRDVLLAGLRFFSRVGYLRSLEGSDSV